MTPGDVVSLLPVLPQLSNTASSAMSPCYTSNSSAKPLSPAPLLAPIVPLPADSLRPVTRSLRGIHQPKKHTDGTVAWLATCMAQAASDPHSEPRHFRAVMGIPHWREAMETEFDALIKNGTWQLTPPRSGINVIMRGMHVLLQFYVTMGFWPPLLTHLYLFFSSLMSLCIFLFMWMISLS